MGKALNGRRDRVVLATKFHGRMAGQDVVLDEATLDRIDELVPPGTNVNPADAGWTSPALDKKARRR